MTSIFGQSAFCRSIRLAVPIKSDALFDLQHGSMDGPEQCRRRQELKSLHGDHIAIDPAAADDGAGRDIPFDHGMFAEDQRARSMDLT